MKNDLGALRTVLDAEGIDGGLRLLNGGVAHRYTAVYRIAGSTLKNIALHDKAGEIKPEFLDEVPFTHSFCQFVLRDGLFLTRNSGQDSRLDGHPYQGVMVSYHGVPLLDNGGELFGTLCHFDVSEQGLSDEDFAFLQQAAKLLPPYALRAVR